MRLLHSNGFCSRISRSTAKDKLKQHSRRCHAIMESLEERRLFSVQTVVPAKGIASIDMMHIQQAITDAGAGGTVIFPANNTYALSPQGISDVDDPQAPNPTPLISLSYPVTLEGASDGSSVLLVEGTNGTGNSSTPNDYYSVFATPSVGGGKFAGQQNLAGLQMLNLTVNQLGPSVNPMGTGVLGYSSQRFVLAVGGGTTAISPIVVNHCTFTGINDINTILLASGGSLNATVENCTFTNIGGDAPANVPHDNSTVYIGANGAGTTPATGAIVIENNHFTSAAKTENNDTVSVTGAMASVETHGSNIFVLNNTVDGYYRGGNPDNITGQFSSNQEWTGNTYTNVGEGFFINDNTNGGGLGKGALGFSNLFFSNNTIQINASEFSSTSNANSQFENYQDSGRAAGFLFNKGSLLSMSDITISNNSITWLNPTSVPAESNFALAQAQESSGISLPELSAANGGGATFSRLTIQGNTMADPFGAGIYLDDPIPNGINELQISGNVIVDPAFADDIAGDKFQLGNQADAVYLGDTVTDAEISSNRFTWNTAHNPSEPVFNIYDNTTSGGNTDYFGNITSNGAFPPAAIMTHAGTGPAWLAGPLPGNEYFFTGTTSFTGGTSFPLTVHGTGPGTVYLVVVEETANANQQETMAPIPVTFTAGVTSINETIPVENPSQTTGGFDIAIYRWNPGAVMASPTITRGAPAVATFAFSSSPAIKAPALMAQQATPNAQVAGAASVAQPSGTTSQANDLVNNAVVSNAVMTDNTADPVSLDNQPSTQFWEQRRHGRHIGHR